MDSWLEYDDIINQDIDIPSNDLSGSGTLCVGVHSSLLENSLNSIDSFISSKEEISWCGNQSTPIATKSHLSCINPQYVNPFDTSPVSVDTEFQDTYLLDAPSFAQPHFSERQSVDKTRSRCLSRNRRRKRRPNLHKNHQRLLGMSFPKDGFRRMPAESVNFSYFRDTGFNEPTIFPSSDTQNTRQLNLSKIATLIGYDCPLALVDVVTQKQIPNKMDMESWVKYMSLEPSKRGRIYDVLSLEVSTTKLAYYVRKPNIVRDLDLVNTVWPPGSFALGEYPHVDTYCLMSAENSYTEFHIEFGGSSAYYNILDGCKIFYLIPGTSKNWEAYTAWLTSSNDSDKKFLPNMVDVCYCVEVHSQQTILVPSGWIYAVVTPCDTISIAGNFLTFLHIYPQLSIYNLELQLGIEKEYQYPYFESIMWYTAIHFYLAFPDNSSRDGIDDIIAEYETGRLFDINAFTEQELDGFEELLNYLYIRAQILRDCDIIIDIYNEPVKISKNNGYNSAYTMVPPDLDEICVDFVQKFGAWITYHHRRSAKHPSCNCFSHLQTKLIDSGPKPANNSYQHQSNFIGVVISTNHNIIKKCQESQIQTGKDNCSFQLVKKRIKSTKKAPSWRSIIKAFKKRENTRCNFLSSLHATTFREDIVVRPKIKSFVLEQLIFQALFSFAINWTPSFFLNHSNFENIALSKETFNFGGEANCENTDTTLFTTWGDQGFRPSDSICYNDFNLLETANSDAEASIHELELQPLNAVNEREVDISQTDMTPSTALDTRVDSLPEFSNLILSPSSNDDSFQLDDLLSPSSSNLKQQIQKVVPQNSLEFSVGEKEKKAAEYSLLHTFSYKRLSMENEKPDTTKVPLKYNIQHEEMKAYRRKNDLEYIDQHFASSKSGISNGRNNNKEVNLTKAENVGIKKRRIMKNENNIYDFEDRSPVREKWGHRLRSRGAS